MTPEQVDRLREFCFGKQPDSENVQRKDESKAMPITIGHLSSHGGTGWYVWSAEDPERGSFFLG